METGSRLAEDSAQIPNGDEIGPEERLQRIVLDALRPEPDELEPAETQPSQAERDYPRVDQSVRQSAVASPRRVGSNAADGVEPAVGTPRAGSGGWRSVGLFLAIMIAAMAVGGAVLRGLGHLQVQQNTVPPSQPAATEPIQLALPSASLTTPAPLAEIVPQPPTVVVESGSSKVQPDSPAPPRPLSGTPLPNGVRPTASAAPAKQSSDNSLIQAAPIAPPLADVTRADAGKPSLPQHDAVGVAKSLPPLASAGVPESETGKPILWIYYPFGSTLAVESARSLATQIGSDVAGADFRVQTDLPKIAVIRFSEERNHTLAQSIGGSLANLGYRWRIDNAANSVSLQHNMIEVWLPTKREGRTAP